MDIKNKHLPDAVVVGKRVVVVVVVVVGTGVVVVVVGVGVVVGTVVVVGAGVVGAPHVRLTSSSMMVLRLVKSALSQ